MWILERKQQLLPVTFSKFWWRGDGVSDFTLILPPQQHLCADIDGAQVTVRGVFLQPSTKNTNEVLPRAQRIKQNLGKQVPGCFVIVLLQLRNVT